MELKPCPFCNSPAILKEDFGGGAQFYNCSAPGCTLNTKYGVHINVWNARPIEDELRKRIEELEIKIGTYENLYPDLLYELKRRKL